MADANADKQSGGSQAAQPNAARSAARAWLAMGGGFAAVVLGGLLIFVQLSKARGERLDAHYDRAAARVASQVGLRWESIIRRVTPLGQAQNEDISDSDLASLRGDGSVEIIDCPASLGARGSFVSDDGSSVIRRIRKKKCAQIGFGTLLKGPRTNFTGNKTRARRFEQTYLITADGVVLSQELNAPQLMTNVVAFADGRGTTKQPLRAAPAMTTATLGATTYRAFLRPVRMFQQRADELPPLFVCGLVQEAQLVKDGQRVESSYELLGVFLLLMAALVLPSAKLWLIGPHVRYRLRDVRIFELATVVGVVLSLVLVLAAVGREALRADLDRKLEHTAKVLGGKVSKSIDAAASQLASFALNEGPSLGKSAQPDACSKDPLPAHLKAIEGPWNVVFRLDERGQQVSKYFETLRTPCVNVAEREYFKSLQDFTTHDLRADDSGREPPLRGSAEVVRSRTTGAVVLITAMRHPTAPKDALALEVPIDELTRQVLPRGVQTAVIDARRRVMLHSDNAAFQEQLFLDDVASAQQPELRRALAARLRGAIDVEYLGAPSRLYLEPLQAGWFAIAIAPTELLDQPTRQIVVVTLLLSLLALACVPLCLVAVALARRSWQRRPQAGSARPSIYELGARRTALALPSTIPPLRWRLRLVRTFEGTSRSAQVCVLAVVVASVFSIAFGRFAEDSAHADLLHAARQRQRHGDCYDGTRVCVELDDVEGSPARAVSASEAGLFERLRFKAMDLTSWLPLELDATVLPERARSEDAQLPWQTTRGVDTLELTGRPLAHVLRAGIPSWTEGLSLDARNVVFVLFVLAGIGLALAAARLSFARLTFVDARPDPGAPILVDELFEAESERVLVLYPQRQLAEQLRERGVRELRPGELLDAYQPAFLADAEQFFHAPEAFAATVAAHTGPLFVLSAVDWTRWLAPEQRVLLDRTFAGFVLLRGPGVGRWPELDTDRRALASALWASCNPDERLLLARLALDGYIAPCRGNWPLVRHLRSRGILAPDRLVFAERHFRRYVEHTASGAQLRNGASTEQQDRWNAIRVPLSTAIGLLIAFMTYMQPELAALGLPISSLLAAAPTFLKSLGSTPS